MRVMVCLELALDSSSSLAMSDQELDQSVPVSFPLEDASQSQDCVANYDREPGRK